MGCCVEGEGGAVLTWMNITKLLFQSERKRAGRLGLQLSPLVVDQVQKSVQINVIKAEL